MEHLGTRSRCFGANPAALRAELSFSGRGSDFGGPGPCTAAKPSQNGARRRGPGAHTALGDPRGPLGRLGVGLGFRVCSIHSTKNLRRLRRRPPSGI